MQASSIRADVQPAVSLTYSGGALTHVVELVALLTAKDLHATFYPAPTAILDAPQVWQSAAANHEIGNASFSGVSIDGDLPNWTLAMVEADLVETEKLLTELFPDQSSRSFAYSGPSAMCLKTLDERGEVSYEPVVRRHFQAAVLHTRGVNAPGDADVHRLRTIHLMDPDEALRLADQAMRDKHWIIFRIDTLEGPASMAHTRLCEWLDQNRAQIDTGTVIDRALLSQGTAPAKR